MVFPDKNGGSVGRVERGVKISVPTTTSIYLLIASELDKVVPNLTEEEGERLIKRKEGLMEKINQAVKEVVED